MEAASPASNGGAAAGIPGAWAQRGSGSSHACRATLGYSGGVRAPMRFLIGFGMVTARTLAGVFLASAGLAIVCSSLAEIDPHPAAQRWQDSSLHPVAALAWAQGRCDTRLTLSPGTPRLQAEDLLQVAGDFDALEQQRGRRATCRQATALAANVSAGADPSEGSGQGDVASLR